MLIRLLDFEGNDIYVHIDTKAHDFDAEHFRAIPKKSNLSFVPRMDNTWGSFTQIEVELCLFKAAAQKNYSYYHLLSGVDLPLKPAPEIYEFFEHNRTKEFVHFCTQEFCASPSVTQRVSLYHTFAGKSKHNYDVYALLEKISITFQRLVGTNRLKTFANTIYCGSNWVSITNNFVHYLLSKESSIRELFQKSSCADELFVQTTLMNSPFKDNLYRPCYSDTYEANMRFIDWKRGNPYVFTSTDFDQLMNSGCLFARKFDWDEDKEICNRIFDTLLHAAR